MMRRRGYMLCCGVFAHFPSVASAASVLSAATLCNSWAKQSKQFVTVHNVGAQYYANPVKPTVPEPFDHRMGFPAAPCCCHLPIHSAAGRAGAFHSTPCRLQSAGGQGGATLPTPCDFSQEKLTELLDRARTHKNVPEFFTDYFFENDTYKDAPAPHVHYAHRPELLPKIPRCNTCGCPIAQHASKRELKQLIQRDNESKPPPIHEPPKYVAGLLKVEFLEAKPGESWVIEPGKSSLRAMRTQEHPRLWELIEKLRADWKGTVEDVGVLLIGHPGIGKTHALDVLMSWNLHEHPDMPVIFITIAHVRIFLMQGGVLQLFRAFTRSATSNPDQFAEELVGLGVSKGTEVFVLHDIKDRNHLDYKSEFLIVLRKSFRLTVVVASSPKESNYKDFCKDFSRTCRMFRMSVFTEDEAWQFMEKTDPSVSYNKFVDRFYKVGGVPRNLSSDEAVEAACQKQNAVAVTVTPLTRNVIKQFPDNSHAIVVDVPNEDRTGIREQTFVSEQACLTWIQVHTHNKKISSPTDLWTAYYKSFSEGECRPIQGYWFERCVRTVLERAAVELSFTPLLKATGAAPAASSPTAPPKWERWIIPKLVRTDVEGQDAEGVKQTSMPTLFIPKNSNFPFVDFIIVNNTSVTLIQVTVGDEHPPGWKSVDKVLVHLKKNNLAVEKIVWVVPSTTDFKSWQSIYDVADALNVTNPQVRITRQQLITDYESVPQYVCFLEEVLRWVAPKSNPDEAVHLALPLEKTNLTDAELLALIQKKVDSAATKIEPLKKKKRTGTQQGTTADDPILFS